MDEVDIKVVCAWCGMHIRGSTLAPYTSHTICPECAEREIMGMDNVYAPPQHNGSLWDAWQDTGEEG